MIHLRSFHSVAQEGSVSKAARAQGVSQPTISLQIHALEETYGVKLFQKRGRGIELTRFGRELLKLTSGMFTYVDAAEDLLTGGRDLTGGRLLLGASNPHQIVPLMAAFGERYPAVSLSLTILNEEGLIEALREQRIDVAVHASPPRGDDFETVLLSREPIVVCAAANHPWAARKTVPLRDLIGEQLIVREQGIWTRTLIDDAFHDAGIRPERMMVVNDWDSIRELVAAGLGVSALSVTDSGNSDRIVRIPLRDPKLTIEKSLLFLPERRRLRALGAFLELAAEALSKR